MKDLWEVVQRLGAAPMNEVSSDYRDAYSRLVYAAEDLIETSRFF
jgi:hypothetical protein